MSNSPGRALAGRYRLLDVIGRGGMGTVWRARDELLGREVAVKEVLLPPEMPTAERETLYQRTIREARTAARLNHPSVVTVYDVAEEDDRPWIVMELVPARPLDSLVADEGPLSPQRTARMGAQILGALRTAHAASVLHRDVKPGNVLVGDGDRVVLTDFGIATIDGDASITQSGMVVGSPAYLAPERARGERATPASDLWALGATLFMAVEGHGPYDRDSSMAALGAVLTEEPPAAVEAGPLSPVIEGLLIRDPDRRMGADRVAELLDEVIAGVSPWVIKAPAPAEAATAEFTPPKVAAPERRRRAPLFPVVLGLLMLAASLGGGAWVLAHDDPRFPVLSLASPTPGTATSPTPSPAAPATVSPSASVPPGFQVVRDRLGFTVALPADWRERGRADGAVTYGAPGDVSYLMVDRSDQPEHDPLANLTDMSTTAREGEKYPGLRTLRLQAGTYLGRPAADWEFTWRLGDGTTVRCLDRQVALPDGHSLAVYWQTADTNWSSDQSGITTAFTSLRLADG
ncbi:MAG TPA: protein kinase [Streptosporangiaceae bacterium]|jgi:hypothetical protein